MNIDYTRYYSRFHLDTPEHLAAMRQHYEQLLAPCLPADRAAPVLDVGCGMGFALDTLRALGYTALTGVDTDPGQVAAARRLHLPAELVDDSRRWLEAHPATFELILATDVIEHVPVPEQLAFVRALAAALRPCGTLLCRVPNASSALAAHWRYSDWTHHNSFTTHSLDFLLHNGGFRDIRVMAGDVVRPPRWWWCRPNRAWCYWFAFLLFRRFRRWEMMAELGPEEGRRVPLSLNLQGVARKA